MNGHLSCCDFLSTGNKAAWSMGIQIPLWDIAFNFCEPRPQSRNAGLDANSVSIFEELLYCFPRWLQHFTSANCAQRSSFLHILAKPGYFLFRFCFCFALFIIAFLMGLRWSGHVFLAISLGGVPFVE